VSEGRVGEITAWFVCVHVCVHYAPFLWQRTLLLMYRRVLGPGFSVAAYSATDGPGRFL
jgi:hypothetical protein